MKNKALKRSGCLLICLFLIAVLPSEAQTDPHFTQNYTYPMYINPALTGSSDGEYRVSAIYRSQWGSINTPYRTNGISFDARTNKNIALGVNLLNQSAGDGGFNYLSTYGSVAYTGLKFGKGNNQRVVFGMQAGIMNRRVDQTKFKWGEQWNPITGYNASNATTETFERSSATTLDIGAGVLYFDASPDRKTNFFGGFSAFHINKPKDPIISTQNTELNTIPIRYTLHGGLNINLSDRARIVPHALYMHQGTAYEAMAGMYVQYTVNPEIDVMIGGYYRAKDAVAPFFGFDWKNFVVGLSYDVNASKLGVVTKNVNSFELSLSYIKRKGGAAGILDFIRCARL
jgi:type IX secretion system PorP/SprF family membrane protein